MNLNIFGWRNISHSFSLVNQHQIVALLKHPLLKIFHEDAPFLSNNWSSENCGAGFSASQQSSIDNIPPCLETTRDWTYEICYPFFSYNRRSDEPVAHFVVANYGVTKRDFFRHADFSELRFDDDDLIITPTNWSREKICQYGFPEERVRVVHHGVDLQAFYPLSSEERSATRKTLGISSDQFCFLNVGALSANKGLDILIKAFAKVASKFPNARLLIKDQNYLYGAKAQSVIQSIFNTMTTAEVELVTTKSISLSSNLTVQQLRLLYGACDCYISPYRAEGFNLPVLEAMGCGSSILVTDGGATDDFVFSDDSKFSSKKIPNSELSRLGVTDERLEIDSYYLEPELDSVISRMFETINRATSEPTQYLQLPEFTWDKVSHDLMSNLSRP